MMSIKQMQEKEAVTDELKGKEQRGWIRRMNSTQKRTEENVLNGLIY